MKRILDLIAPHRVIFRHDALKYSPDDDFRVFIGACPIPYAIEDQHIVAIGATGSGKTVCFQRAIQRILRRPMDRIVVLDADGSLFEKIGRPEDLNVNIFDARAPCWDLAGEIESETGPEALAARAVPSVSISGEAAEWMRYTRTICESIFATSPMASPTELYQRFFLSSHNELRRLVENTPARRMFERGAEKMLAGVLGILSSRMSYLRYLRDPSPGVNPFTFTGWGREAPPGSRLFLTYKINQKPALMPMYSTGLGLLISELLSQQPIPPHEPSLYRKTWIIGDEFGLLGCIAGMDEALTNGRRFGLTIAAGFQDIHMIREAYGRNVSNSILNSFGTWLVMCQNEGESAAYFSHCLGDRQVIRSLNSTSKSISGEHKNKTLTQADNIHNEQLVLTGELLHLPNRIGFLRVRGDPILHEVELPLCTWPPSHTPAFIPRVFVPLPPLGTGMIGGEASLEALDPSTILGAESNGNK